MPRTKESVENASLIMMIISKRPIILFTDKNNLSVLSELTRQLYI